MNIEQVLAMDEYQIFDRKSIQVAPTSLSDLICAFANADGGTVAVGISDKTKRIEGVDAYLPKVNELLRVPIDFCNPTVPVETEMVPCVNADGKPDHVLLMKVEASPLLHANQADEAFVRVGDKTKKLSFQDRLTLMYAKGLRHFEDEPVYGATLEDIDLDFVAEYVHRIGYTKTAEEYLRQNKNFVNGDKISTVAILLFGKNPQHFFPRARIRFIRFDGHEAKVGKDMNVIKDVIFEGRILNQVQQAVDYIKIQMKERTYLGKDAVFVTEEEYGEFVRTEIVVNAATHRDYAIMGTDIQIKMFDDRLEVDSPGSFAGMVKKENIRYTHFSRNPKIAAFLKDYGFVKEYGEGVDRMCRELNAIGLPDPVFDNNTFILKTTICSAAYEKLPIQKKEVGDSAKNVAIEAQEVGDSAKNVAIEAREVGDSAKNVAIEEREVGDSAKNVAIEMIPLSEVLRLCAIQNYNQATINNINRLYEDIELNQIFNTGYICKLFSCSSSGARKILARLRIIDVVVPVKGKGKGQYRFKYKSEM